MRKNEVISYLVMENISEPSKVNNLQVFDKGPIFYVRFETILQTFNTKNRNGRIYLGECMQDAFRSEHIIELMRKKSWCGEAGHPISDDTKRILTIDVKSASHKMVSVNPTNSMVTGVIETLSDGNRMGNSMTHMILQGMEPAFSLRALAPISKRGNGDMIIQSKPHIVTYDWVILPSHREAYRDESKPISLINKGLSYNSNVNLESTMIEVNESSLYSYIKEESRNLKLISSICEVASDIVKLSRDKKFVILSEGSRTYHIKLEDYIENDVKNYLSNLDKY